MGGARRYLRHPFPEMSVFPAPLSLPPAASVGLPSICSGHTYRHGTYRVLLQHSQSHWVGTSNDNTVQRGQAGRLIKGSEVTPLTSPGRAQEEGGGIHSGEKRREGRRVSPGKAMAGQTQAREQERFGNTE